MLEGLGHHHVGQHDEHRSGRKSLDDALIGAGDPLDESIPQHGTRGGKDDQHQPHQEDVPATMTGRQEVRGSGHPLRKVRDEDRRQEGHADGPAHRETDAEHDRLGDGVQESPDEDGGPGTLFLSSRDGLAMPSTPVVHEPIAAEECQRAPHEAHGHLPTTER